MELRGGKILIVDDSPANVGVLFDYFQKLGLTVLISQTGEDALEIVKENPPDIILLDILMPGIGGFETCRRLKADFYTKDIPVLFVSSLSDTVDKVRGFEAGGVDYITKPFQGEEVLARVKTHIDISRLKRRLEEKNKLLQDEIEKHKQTQVELEQARKSAEHANLAKSGFLADMSHEIRTPLNAIIGMTELTLMTPLNLEQRDFLQTVRMSAESLLHLINDILDFSKIEAGRLDLEEIPFNLQVLIESVLKVLAVKAHEKGLELMGFVNPDVPVLLIGDPQRIRQILVNLLGNAIKFTEHGEVCIKVEKSPDKRGIASTLQGGEFLCFSVSDTGIGIAPDQMKRIFERFTQAGGHIRRRFGGTGLGTAISKLLVEKMSGEIWAESNPGTGSTFYFTIFVKPESTESENIRLSGLKGLKALLVDDNECSSQILKDIANFWEVTPIVANSGSAALKYIESKDTFDFAIIDADMPEMSGFDLAQTIRKQHGFKELPMILLTLTTSTKKLPDCYKTAYHTKPVRQKELYNTIISVLEGRNLLLIDKNDQQAIKTSLKNINILLAEDNPFNQKLTVTLLNQRGHNVFAVENGKLAINAWETARFDMILMDIQMPEMDGIEATRIIRDKEKNTGAHIPIVAMTASAMEEDRRQVFEAGMDAYITKPIQIGEFLSTVENLVASESETNSETSSQLFDKDKLLSLIDNDTDMMETLIQLYLENFPKPMSEIRQAISQSDTRMLTSAAHYLKGMSANIGANQVAHEALILEKMGKSGDLKNAETAFCNLKNSIERLCSILTRYLEKISGEY